MKKNPPYCSVIQGLCEFIVFVSDFAIDSKTNKRESVYLTITAQLKNHLHINEKHRGLSSPFPHEAKYFNT